MLREVTVKRNGHGKGARRFHTYGRSLVDWDGRGESEICQSAWNREQVLMSSTW